MANVRSAGIYNDGKLELSKRAGFFSNEIILIEIRPSFYSAQHFMTFDPEKFPHTCAALENLMEAIEKDKKI